ncbi:MAG TPA: type 1 glutamine amidotransferase [Solirubrobacteraceae bacterium]|nr:type 1 glutamine amidotransferase [Solirubrobacteraceae bacterium]
MSSKPALIFQHGRLGPPARVAEWLDERGLPYVVHHGGEDGSVTPTDYSFVVSLGSQHSVTATDPPWVRAEISALRGAVDAGVPVLGLCFGGQALSLALGGGIDVLDRPEIGWLPVDTVDGDLVPGGPWLMWHTEQMRVPAGATELARSPAGPAAFTVGPHLAVQFHPEVDVERVAAWAEKDEHLADAGLTADDVVAQSELHAPAAREQAFRMFDRWLAGAVNGHGPGSSGAR